MDPRWRCAPDLEAEVKAVMSVKSEEKNNNFLQLCQNLRAKLCTSSGEAHGAASYNNEITKPPTDSFTEKLQICGKPYPVSFSLISS